MTTPERIKNYQYHHKNIKLIEHSICLIKDNIKDTYIKEYEIDSDFKNSSTKSHFKKIITTNRNAYIKLLLGIVASWSEELLKRLLYEQNAFTNEQILGIHKLKDARQKWVITFKISFCKQFFSVTKSDPLFMKIQNPESESKINKSLRNKYLDVKNLIEKEIFPVIDLRNKVQHGEWEFAFTPPHSIAFDQQITTLIRRENIRTIQTKVNDIKAIYRMITDLGTYNKQNKFNLDKKSSPFEYFFDSNYERIEFNNKNLNTFTEKKYREDIIGRYLRGKSYMQK